jgi:uncharacterized protein (TIGR03435 family)
VVRLIALTAMFWGPTLSEAQGAAEAPVEFEVASIKSAPLLSACGYRMEGGPGTSDPGRITFHNISLAALVRFAYLGQVHACQSYVLSAPGWLDSDGFEIAAKLPPGATWPQLRTMLQNLLAERFKLAVHSEPKIISGFALVVVKNGPKFKESANDPAASAGDDSGSPKSRPKVTMDSEGFPVPAPPGSWIITRGGHTRMQQLRVDMGTFARQLTNQLGIPVTDATALKGTYDLSLSWAPDSTAISNGDPAPDLFVAVQQQLGLRLELSKTTIEVIVVDHAERVPIEN